MKSRILGKDLQVSEIGFDMESKDVNKPLVPDSRPEVIRHRQTPPSSGLESLSVILIAVYGAYASRKRGIRSSLCNSV